MSVNSSRSLNGSLDKGSGDGRYRRARPDTEVIAGKGDEATMANRQSLHPFSGFDFITSEYPDQKNPGK